MASREKVAHLIRKIQHYLIAKFGKRLQRATHEEFYQAFSHALREEIMINWAATQLTIEEHKAKTLYYLSLEYLPGRELGGNITNLGARELVLALLDKTDRNYADLLACEADPGLGNGGLGRLASCFLESLAAQQFPAWGYGLRYQYGIFAQEIWDCVQVERPDVWLLNEYPWDFRRDSNAVFVDFFGRIIPTRNRHKDEVYHLEDFEEVRALPYDNPIIGCPKGGTFSVLSLRLWSTKESPRNFALQRYNAGQLDQAGENTSLTDVLYPNDNHELGKRIRLKQEFLLVSASLQDILIRFFHCYDDPAMLADKVCLQINDTHPALIVAELVRILTLEHDVSFNDAWEITKACCSYTNHTILREALEEWNENRVQDLLPRQYEIIKQIDERFCKEVREKYPGNEKKIEDMSLIHAGQIRMAHLAIIGSHKVNGVAALHTQILKEQLFSDFHQMYPAKFLNVTNGVTHRRWLLHANPELSQLISDKIGDRWVTDFRAIEKLGDFANDRSVQKAFLEIKVFRKNLLLDYLSKENPLRDAHGKITGHSKVLETSALIDVHIKRVHEYKRQLMNALHIIMLYFGLKKDPSSRKIKRMVIIGGKAAPGYQTAKDIIRLIFAIARKVNQDPDVNDKLCIAFIENYNVSSAEIVIPAADLSEQISRAGKEASGTGNMKLAMNGALTIATADGANIEMREAIKDAWWPFHFGLDASEISKLIAENSYDPQEIYTHDEEIRQALDALKNDTFALNKEEKLAFTNLYSNLLQSTPGHRADTYFILRDLRSYFNTQKKVEELYLQPYKWAEYALHNIAGMGRFSSDESIYNYAEKIWKISPCPPDLHIVKKVKEEFIESGGALIFSNNG